MAKREGGTPYVHQEEAIKLGLRIRTLRLERSMTQRDLALEADIDDSTVLRIEKARLVITVDLLFAIAHAFKVSPKELLDF